MESRRGVVTGAWILLLGMAFGMTPASAGSEDDPEIDADCDFGSATGTIEVGEEFVVCKGWFETEFEEVDPPTADGPPPVRGIRTTVQVKGDYEDRQRPGYVTLAWTNGGCRERWSYADVVASPSTLTLYRHCGDDSVSVDLPLEQLELNGSDVTVTVYVEDLETVGSGVVHGSRLEAPSAAAAFLIRAPGENVFDLAVGGNEVGPGRDYVVGSD